MDTLRARVVRHDELSNARRDVIAETRPVEDAVVTDLRARVAVPRVRIDIRRQIVGGMTLPKTSNIILLTLNRHERRAMNDIQIDLLSPVCKARSSQIMFHKHRIDSLEVELGRQIHDREVLIIEGAVFFSRVAITGDQVAEEIPVCVEMSIEIHGHEARELQEPWIDWAACTCIPPRNNRDHMVLEP